jgi:hypothetical protein
MEDIGGGDDIRIAWETIVENIKISPNESLSYYELEQHKP